MISADLHDGWTLTAVGGQIPDRISASPVPAQVPGSVHTDLLSAGLIRDPYVGLTEAELVWMHRADWRYERNLTRPLLADGERADLVFEGLDTVATITLGDTVLGHTYNQHRTFRFDIRDELAAGDAGGTTLAVGFRSALEYAESEAARIGARPAAYDHPLNMVRKMACSFGWDWGPDLQTAGIWRPVRLQRWSVARLASVRPLVSIDETGAARVTVHVDVERSGLELAEGALTVHARLSPAADVTATRAAIDAVVTIAPGSCSGMIDVVVTEPALWWPRGYGDQPLYDLDIELRSAGSRPERASAADPLDGWHRRIGLRTVDLDTRDDDIGTAFVIRVNDTPIFVKGANWIPDDHLLTRITRDRIANRITQAVDANINLLRVWGGGIYESEDFYELCDEAGVMVWQDFLLACAAYPEEEPQLGEFEAEAREHIARLSAHPSLVLWNGGNENLWGYMDWGWQELLAGRTWGHRYYTEIFPQALAELDPTRPYAQGSPYSPGAALNDTDPNDPDHGTHHQWEVWNRIDYTAYREEIPRFCSEFGFQAPPAWHTVVRAMSRPDGSPGGKQDPIWLLHQKAEDGNDKLDRGLEPHIGVPDDFVDWHWATQLNQARAVAHAITHYRSWWPRTAGAIVWQLNDCWPVTSWSAIDGDEIAKPLWWALRASYADRILTVQSRLDPVTGQARDVLAVINDTAERWTGPVHLRRERLDGGALAQEHISVDAPARSVILLDLPDSVRLPGDPAAEVLVAELTDPMDDSTVREVHCWVEDIDLRLDPNPITAVVDPVDDGYRVTVSAHSLVKDLTLLVDRLDPAASIDQALVTLPAGESVTLHIRTAVRGIELAVSSRPVLRTANDLTAERAGRSGSEQSLEVKQLSTSLPG